VRVDVAAEASADPSKRPTKSFVFTRGEVAGDVKLLANDLRKVMEPHTATKLKSQRANVLKDYINVAGPLGITHLIPFSQGSRGAVNMRVGRMPRGPTITLRVKSYTSMADVASSQRRPVSSQLAYMHSPLVILNNFGATQEQHTQLMAVLFQNMFPAIDIATVKLSDSKRVAMFHLDKETNEVEFRHYFIRTKAADTSRQVKRVLRKGSKGPNLSKLQDISDLFDPEAEVAYGSESEGEDDPSTHVEVLNQAKQRPGWRDRKKGSSGVRKSAVRLQELGPRIRMKLLKVEDGLFDGDIIHHAYVKKTPEEAAKLREMRKMRDAERNKRKSAQAEAVAKKKARIEAAGSRNSRGKDRAGLKAFQNDAKDEDEDDDEAYFREQVGEDREDDGEDDGGKVKGSKGKGIGGRVFGQKRKRA